MAHVGSICISVTMNRINVKTQIHLEISETKQIDTIFDPTSPCHNLGKGQTNLKNKTAMARHGLRSSQDEATTYTNLL